MNIYFRADASIGIGSGHVMRCLTLAVELRTNGADVHFLCRDLPGNMASIIKQQGFKVEMLPVAAGPIDWQQDSIITAQIIENSQTFPDWVIVDNYALDWRWESSIRSCCKQIMVIDDLANRKHDCELLLDQNYYSDMSHRYQELVPADCRLLLGPEYALLRREFVEARATMTAKRDYIKKLLIFFGGSDPTNETMKALQAIQILKPHDITIDVVIGSSNPRKVMLQELCSKIPGVVLHCQINNMAEFMAEADLAVGAGGTTSWERCFLGLPTIGVIVADNQERLVCDLAKFGAMVSLGRSESVTPLTIADAVAQLITNNEMRRIIRERCQELMPGNGTGTVIKALMGDSNV
jgi:UDP-2,4-diacetamido-2,4,6-trideoxy-beta-L-altropyranose hydrolase